MAGPALKLQTDNLETIGGTLGGKSWLERIALPYPSVSRLKLRRGKWIH